jgi:hypothetical protein
MVPIPETSTGSKIISRLLGVVRCPDTSVQANRRLDLRLQDGVVENVVVRQRQCSAVTAWQHS